ncbi:unnamed protein product, partial [Ectocarpus sp. 4 AP-2014]
PHRRSGSARGPPRPGGTLPAGANGRGPQRHPSRYLAAPWPLVLLLRVSAISPRTIVGASPPVGARGLSWGSGGSGGGGGPGASTAGAPPHVYGQPPLILRAPPPTIILATPARVPYPTVGGGRGRIRERGTSEAVRGRAHRVTRRDAPAATTDASGRSFRRARSVAGAHVVTATVRRLAGWNQIFSGWIVFWLVSGVVRRL